MSVAGKPDPRRAPVAALMAGLALALAVLVVSLTLIATRQAAPPVPGPVHRPKPPAGPIRPAPAHGSATARRPGPRSELNARSQPAPPPQRPLVRIVERRAPVERNAPAAGLQPPKGHGPAPVPAGVDRPARQDRTSSPRRDVVELPPPAAGLPPPVADEAEPDVLPEPVVRVPADYPEDAADQDVTGSVRLKVIVDRRGRVEDAIVVRSAGDDRLDAAAVTAVRRWRYRPARRSGRPVTGIDYVVVDFYREDRPPAGE